MAAVAAVLGSSRLAAAARTAGWRGLRLYELGLFEPRRVSVCGGDGGEVLRVHALARAHRLPRPDRRVERPAHLDHECRPERRSEPRSPAYKAARQVCKKDLPDLAQTAAEKATANAAALKYATCMRSNGAPNFPDPNGQGLIQAGNIDASSPAFEKAETACKSLDNGFGEEGSGTSVSSWTGRSARLARGSAGRARGDRSLRGRGR
jgi:hypothetical protein